jgi:hypothetical protein
MISGKEYLLGLNTAPSIEPKEGGWALIRTADKTYAVSPVVSGETPWGGFVHVFALVNCPDPVLNQDELVYRNEAGDGESRVITAIRQLN